jgi:hypothetical protein
VVLLVVLSVKFMVIICSHGVSMRSLKFALLIIFSGLSMIAWAVTPQFWENFTQEDLLKGRLDRVSLASDGKLFLAPMYDLVYDTSQSYIFSMVRDKAGNLYVGTGDEGKVFKIDPQGKGSLYFQSGELNIFAMALDSSDTLYVGTSPDGKVYKLSQANQAVEFCNPESKYIWSMDFDDADNLFVGTGPKGILYKVDKSGSKSVFYTSGDSHIRCLLRNNKNLLAGTSPRGLIIEVTPEGKAFALMDTPYEEVHALTADRFGTIYAVASSAKEAIAPTTAKSAVSSAATSTASATTITITAISDLFGKGDESKAAGSGEEKESASAKTAVYALTNKGIVETYYVSNEQMVLDAAVQKDGSLLMATGPKGRLLAIDAARQISVVTDSPEEDAARLLQAGDVTYVGTCNQGKVYKLQSRKAQSGTFESEILNAKLVSSWGKISWHAPNSGTSDIELSTRTGNTEKPDNSWSDWSSSYAAPGQQITSPRARYLQWRASFKDAPGSASSAGIGMLERVQIAYLQQNLRPRITEIELLPHGIELEKQPSLAASGMMIVTSATTASGRSLNAPRERDREQLPMAPRQSLHPGAQSFTWKAVDDNEDSMDYSLYFKGEDESEWKLLEKDLSDTFYTLKTASLPDGTYRLKVVADDKPSNPYDKFLIGERISDSFVVANASPQVDIVENKLDGRKGMVLFRASVSVGSIATAEYSIDGGPWYLVFPSDGIADSSQEEYRFLTPELSPGEHLVGIRASDRNGSTGTAKLILKAP